MRLFGQKVHDSYLVIGLVLICVLFVLNYVSFAGKIGFQVRDTVETSPKQEDVDIGEEIVAALKLSSKNSFCAARPQGAAQRYDRLSNEVDGQFFLISVDFYNNQEIAPDFIIQLREFLLFLGPENVFVSVYENGSKDQTKTYLQLLKLVLYAIKVKYSVIMNFDEKPKDRHRIEYLSQVRNRVLEPIERFSTVDFARVIFLNDVFFCADDIKELLYQSIFQKADIVCGLDYDIDETGDVGFYDTWVGRDVNGRMMDKKPIYSFTHEQVTNERLGEKLPFQVQCCWNGAAILNGLAFSDPTNVRFRKRDTVAMESSHPKYNMLSEALPNTRFYTDCSSSEMNTLCNDFQAFGFNKAIIVPRVAVAYDWKTYDILKRMHYPADMPFADHSKESIKYRTLAETTECLPMNGVGLRSPDGELGRELLVIKDKIGSRISPRQ